MPRPGAARLHRLLRHGRRVLQLEKARIVTYYGLIPLIVFLGDELAYDMYTSAAFSWLRASRCKDGAAADADSATPAGLSGTTRQQI